MTIRRLEPDSGGSLAWVDIAKGVGIILVVFGHVWRGLAEARVLPENGMFAAVDHAIYAFHMPLFFFLSGWFFPAVLRKYPTGQLLHRVVWRLFYPLCLWTYIFIAVKIAAGGSANAPVGLEDLLRLPVPGYLHLWFLWAMILIQGVAIALRPLALRAMVPSFAAALGLSILLLVLPLVPGSAYWNGALRSAPYFFLGGLWACLGPMPAGRTLVGPVIVAFVFADLSAVILAGGTPLQALLIATIATVALLIVLKSFAPVAPVPVRGALIAIGRVSLSIYLIHTIVAAMARIILLKLGVTTLWLHLPVGVGVGVLVPLLIHLPAVPGWLRRGLGLQDVVLGPAAPPRRGLEAA